MRVSGRRHQLSSPRGLAALSDGFTASRASSDAGSRQLRLTLANWLNLGLYSWSIDRIREQARAGPAARQDDGHLVGAARPHTPGLCRGAIHRVISRVQRTRVQDARLLSSVHAGQVRRGSSFMSTYEHRLSKPAGLIVRECVPFVLPAPFRRAVPAKPVMSRSRCVAPVNFMNT